jgi:hypothetical protein
MRLKALIVLLLLFGGRMPQTDNLPHTWYDTPNIHFCTIKDFRDLCTRSEGGSLARSCTSVAEHGEAV